jgi:STE24 endopeptidase
MNSLVVTGLYTTTLVVMLLLRLWLCSRQIRHVAQHRNAVPARFATTVTLADHQRAANYTIVRQRFELVSLAWGAATLIGWTLLGGLDLLNQALLHFVQPRWGDLAYGVSVLVVASLISTVLDWPLDAWRTFRIEQAFGFNRMSWGLWLRDQAMGGVLGLVVGVPLAALVLWLMNAAGATWWLWTFAVLAGFMVLMQVVYPSWIAPLFNRFQPLADVALRERVEGLMQRCGFESQGLFVMDGSKRSAHANAYFTGFGRSKRVVFFDTLLHKLDSDEIESVLAHELGHFRMHHVRKRMITGLGLLLLGLALAAWLIEQPALYFGLGVQPNLLVPNHAVALLLLMWLSGLLGFFFSPWAAAVSRRHEFEADAYACQHGQAGALASALLKLYSGNAATLTPDPMYVRFHYSHPPAAQRLAALPLAQEAA